MVTTLPETETLLPELDEKLASLLNVLWILDAINDVDAMSVEVKLTVTPPTVMSPVVVAVPEMVRVCFSPPSSPPSEREVVGLMNTEPNLFSDVTLNKGISPTRSPAVPLSTGKPFHSVVSAMCTISCLSCWNSKSR